MPARPLRLAFARVNQETNALSPVLTTSADFRSTHWLAAEELLGVCQPRRMEVSGMFRNAELSGFVQACAKMNAVTPVPLLSAWAIPGGPVTEACFDEMTGEIVERLKLAGHIDGVYLSLHGAMGVVGVLEPEALIVRRVREVVGPDLPIVVSLDLHASLCRDLVDNVQAIVAYATNPHRDHARVGARSARILAGTCRGTLHPTMAWRSLPMLMGGGTTIDFLPPMAQIFARLRWMERRGKALSASVLMCHPWNAHPETGWNALVITDGDAPAAARLVDELAETCWRVRHQMPPDFHTPEAAVALAKEARLARKLGVVVMADASDVVSAGAPGENTHLLRVLLRDASDLRTFVPLRDPELVARLWSVADGTLVSETIGAKLDPEHGKSLDLQAVLLHKREAHGIGRIVVLKAGGVHLVVVEGPPLAVKPEFFRNAGLRPWSADIIVVKNFFPFRMFFLPMARLTLYVKSGGVTDFDAAHGLTFAGPVHPRDAVEDWHPADQRRRGTAG